MFTQAVESCSKDRIKWRESPSTSVESKSSQIDCNKTRCHSIKITQCKHVFLLQSNQNTCKLIMLKHTFQLWILVLRLSHSINQCKCTLSDGLCSMVAGWNVLLGWHCWHCWVAVERGMGFIHEVCPMKHRGHDRCEYSCCSLQWAY
jgi:hypothetical protein